MMIFFKFRCQIFPEGECNKQAKVCCKELEKVFSNCGKHLNINPYKLISFNISKTLKEIVISNNFYQHYALRY